MEAIKKFRSSSSFFMATAFSLSLVLAGGIITYIIISSIGGFEVENWELKNWLALGFGGLVLGIIILLGIGFFVIGVFVVKKVNSIAETASDIIETGNISKRIPLDSTWDDLSKLAAVLNRMLCEIESLVANTKSVTDSIAHDLRTPLTRLRNDLEKIENKAQRQELLKEADTLLAMFNGLLHLAEIENDAGGFCFAMLDLKQIAQDAEALYRPLADEKNISINSVIKPCTLSGERNLLFQAFSNVIDNAIKFTPKGKDIDIILEQKNQGKKSIIIFCVKDSGPGIPEAEQENIFRQFYRLDKNRSTPGHGLGLSIVKAIADLHHAQIRLRNSDSGMAFEMEFARAVKQPLEAAKRSPAPCGNAAQKN